MSLRLQAESGDASAQLRLGRMLISGGEIKPAPQEGARLVKAAADQGHAEALLLHAALATLGLARPQNLQEAFDLVTRAAARGDKHAKGQLAALSNAEGKFDLAFWGGRMTVVPHFTAPRIFTIKNFLSKPACDWLMQAARGRLTRAEVVDHATRGPRPDPDRTNKVAMFPALHADVVLQLVRLRIAAATSIPAGNQEPTNVLRYGRGEEYKPHFDYFLAHEAETFSAEVQNFGQRIGTFLIYLNEGYEGGETAFPRLDWRFKGETGDALLFWNCTAQGVLEPLALHAGMPVIKGEKWLLSQWIRAKPVPLARFAMGRA